MRYTEEQIRKIEAERRTIRPKLERLMIRLSNRKIKTDRAREFALHGVARRLHVIGRCIENVFAHIPVGVTTPPPEEARLDATISIQSLILNVFGCFDNLAWVWVLEQGITKTNGNQLRPGAIGFGEKCEEVRASLPPSIATWLEENKEWFSEHLEDVRHALAHRIPLYIAPFQIDLSDQDRFMLLEKEKLSALLRQDHQESERLQAEQDDLIYFAAGYMHSFLRSLNSECFTRRRSPTSTRLNTLRR